MTKSKEVKALLAKAETLVTDLGTFEQFIGSIDSSHLSEAVFLETSFRLDAACTLNKEYKDVYTQLIANSVELNEVTSIVEFDKKFVAVNIQAKILLSKRPEPSSSVIASQSLQSNSNQGANARLQKLPVPTFHGDYASFTAFDEAFTALVHDNSALTDVERFMYLRDSLKGPANQLIANIQPTGDNYKIAFELLRERFNNPKLIVNSHINGIFDLKPISRDNAADLRSLYDNLNKHLRALDNIATPFDYRAIFISNLLMSKFDTSTRLEFSKYKPREIHTLEDINTFLKERCQILEEIEANKGSNNNQNYTSSNKSDSPKGSFSRNNNYSKSKSQFKQSLLLTNNKITCPNCSSNHSLNHCAGFLALSVKQRIDRAGQLRTCKNCLYHSNQSTCNSRYTCQICNRKHHTLLHLDIVRNDNRNNQENNQPSTSNAQTTQASPSAQIITANTQTTLSCFRVNSQQVILPTAIVQVKGRDQKWHKARILMDSCSHINLITETMANKLQLNRDAVSTKILGINSSLSNSNSMVKIQIASLTNNYRATLSCVIIEKIAENLPFNSFNKNTLNLPDNTRLADESFNTSSKVDILIGASLFYNLLSVGQITLGKNKPILQKTVLGWVVSGEYIFNNKSQYKNTACSNLILNNEIEQENKSLEKTVERFWQLENIQPKYEISKLSTEEQFCESHFQKTVVRTCSGRFTVSIPFNSKLMELGESKNQAMDRFLRLEKSLLKNNDLYSEYKKFMNEYITLGHMKRLDNREKIVGNSLATQNSVVSLSNIPDYYLPHHAVIKNGSLTTKLRVVFDGGAKTTTGISINNTQLIGPVVQNDLFSILLRFRQHLIALTGDIEKMYRQIQIEPPLRKFQQILWRDNPRLPVETYQLQTITYGTASASYLATKCLQHLANLNSEKFVIASKIIKNDFYMDDLLTGGDTIQEVSKLQAEITAILSSAELPIRKFLSNNADILSNSLNPNSAYFTVPLGERENAKTLGVSWNSVADVIQYDLANKFTFERNTKRTILSAVAQLFDPLGLLAPVIIKGKLIIQKLWQLNLAWDESIPENLNSEWINFKNQLSDLKLIKIPRCIKLSNHKIIQLHGFSDSSSVAFGCCIYIRCQDESGNIATRLLCSKSRVSPLHGATIPRLELCAALLLAQLVEKVKESLTLHFHEEYLWTDSTIVLHWIKSAPNKYKTFVSNRIASIQELSNKIQWCHVPSQYNPADLVSRGTSIHDLLNNPIWFSGPNFLSLPREQWPSQVIQNTNLPAAEFKIKTDSAVNLINIQKFDIFNQFSSYTKLQRVLAWIMRFRNNLKLSKLNRPLRLSGPLKTAELKASQTILIKLCQAESFVQEYKMLKAKQVLKTSSSILSLNPFLDENNVIRVGGRIKNSDYSFDKKFPALLPKNHELTKLIFKQFHEKLLHCGAQQLLAVVREQYWPISGRNSAKGIVHNCIKCFKATPKSYNPLMGDLPLKRLQPNMPVFTNVGLDYAGPILIKDRKLRGAKLIKSYVCLFVCLVTKAIHIELVTDLSTHAFIAVLKRFISRRGKPFMISSDNAKNFVGAANQLRDLYRWLNSAAVKDEITNFLSNQNIKWEFIIPRAPHQGGIWESGVKSIKLHIKRVLGNASLNYEDFQTVLTQIEATLNSRPLSPLTTDPSDLNPLTPGHFIIGKPLCALPEPNYVTVPENNLSRYQRIQRLVQTFWKRWGREVIPELQRRTKWFRHLPALLRVDSVVLIQEDNLPPLQWCLGRVIEVHASSDNIPRSATVLTSNGHSIKRAVNKLCVLPGV